MVLLSGAAAITIFQVLKGTETSNSHINAVSQVQNAGYWISRDAGMAQSIYTENLTSPAFLIFYWTQFTDDDEKIFHSANYSFEGLNEGIGKLKRTHMSSAGANEQTLIATHIYYAPADQDDTSRAEYQAPLLTLRLTSIVEDAIERREYHIQNRPNVY
jgi:hypothetical protein